MRRAAGVLACTGVLASAALLAGATGAARAEVSRDVRALPFRRPILLPDPAASTGGWPAVAEDSILAGASGPGFADVRVVNEAGESVPFATLTPRRDDFRLDPVAAAPLGGARSGESFARILDLGADPPARVVVELPPWAYLALVQSARGPDPERAEWRPDATGPFPEPAGAAAPGAGRTVVERPDRYLKLTVEPRGGAAPRDTLRAYALVEREVPREEVRFRVRSRGFDGRRWRAVLELTGPARAVTAVRFTRPESLTRPPIAVESRIRGGGWRPVAGRLPADEPGPVARGEVQNEIAFDPVRTDAIRITVSGADPPNPPITVTGVAAIPVRWTFPPPRPGARLWLAYGDRFLGPRDWYLEDAAERAPRYLPAALGPPEANPLHAPPGFGLDWLRRRPGILTGLMIALLAGVALFVLRFRPRPPG